MQRILGNTQNTEKWDHLKSYPSEISSQLFWSVVSVLVILVDFYEIWSICCSFAQSCPTLCNPVDLRGLLPEVNQEGLGRTRLYFLYHPLELAQNHTYLVVMRCNHLVLCHLLLPSVFSSIRVFFNESALCIRWPKYWSFSFSISCSNEYSGLISFRTDWFGLLAVQGTLKSFLQHHSSKTSILLRSTLQSNSHIHS